MALVASEFREFGNLLAPTVWDSPSQSIHPTAAATLDTWVNTVPNSPDFPSLGVGDCHAIAQLCNKQPYSLPSNLTIYRCLYGRKRVSFLLGYFGGFRKKKTIGGGFRLSLPFQSCLDTELIDLLFDRLGDSVLYAISPRLLPDSYAETVMLP